MVEVLKLSIISIVWNQNFYDMDLDFNSHPTVWQFIAKRYKKRFNRTLTTSYSKNVSRDSPWNFIPRLLMICMKIGNQNFKIVWTGSEPKIQIFLRVNRSRMTLRITSKKIYRLHIVHS